MTARRKPRRRAAAAAGRRALDPIEERLEARWSDLKEWVKEKRWSEESISRLAKGKVLAQARLLAKQYHATKRDLHFLLWGRGKLLKKIAIKMRFTVAAIRALEGVEPLAMASLGFSDRRSQLERDVGKIDELLPVVASSGGPREVQFNLVMKKIAARMCHKLMKEAGVEPTAAIGSTWVFFTEILLEIAIGHSYFPGDAYRACRVVAKELRSG